MKTPSSEDTDDEYCDDPIKLFDSNENVVYYGSQSYRHCPKIIDFSWRFEKPKNDDSNLTMDSSENTKSIQTSANGNIADELPKLSVKLVDCGQFPWYFRKYTQQILNLTGINLDSDSEVDVESLENSFVVNTLRKTNNNVVINKVKGNDVNALQPKQLSKSVMDKRRQNIKLQEDFEIRRAMSLKNKVKVDFKRNQGLIGMKIKHRIIQNEPLDPTVIVSNEVKDRKSNHSAVTVDELYIHAADNVLKNIGTQLIPVLENVENTTDKDLPPPVPQSLMTTKNVAFEESSKQNQDSALSNLEQICAKLRDITTRKPKSKNKHKTLNRSLLMCTQSKVIPGNETKAITDNTKPVNALGKALSHVKDVTKTNKYKNDLNKNKERQTTIELMVTTPNKTDTQKAKETNQNEIDISNRTNQNHDNGKREPNSPILPSSLSKKSKAKYDLPKCNELKALCDAFDKSYKHFTNSANYKSQRDDPKINITLDAAAPNNLANTANVEYQTKLQNETIQTIQLDNTLKRIDQNRPQLSKIFNKDDTNSLCGNNNKNLSVNNLTPVSYQDNRNDHLFKIVSVESMSISGSPNRTDKRTGNDKPNSDATPGIANPSSKPKQAKTPKLQTQNSMHDMSQSNPNHNVNVSGHIDFTLPTTITPNYPTIIRVRGKKMEASVTARDSEKPSSAHIPVPTKPRFQSFKNTCHEYQPILSCSQQNYIPRFANKTVENTFSPIVRQLNISTPSQHIYNAQNVAKLAFPPSFSSMKPLRISPYVNPVFYNSYVQPLSYTPISISQPPRTLNQNYDHLKLKDNSVVGKNNCSSLHKIDNLPESLKNNTTENVNKVVSDNKDIQTSTSNDNLEIVATKTQMLKELDKLSTDNDDTNELKRKYPDITVEVKNTSVLRTELTKKPKANQAITETQHKKNTKIKPLKGYSPPILPIPTYDKVFCQIVSDLRTNDPSKITIRKNDVKSKSIKKVKPVRNIPIDKCCKKRLSYEKKSEAKGKKISLEEYKQRVYIDRRLLFNEKMRREKPAVSGEKGIDELKTRVQQQLCNVDKMHRSNNTDTDLGYDSDSTVVL